MSFDAVVDPRLPFPNIGGKPLWMSLRALDDETVEAITALHARARASLTLAGYADYAVLDEGVSPALHHRVICDHIDRLLDDEYDDLIINTPPGAAKSTYTSHALGAYYMGRWPTRNVILATHTADLSEKWSRKVRNTIADPRHAQLFPDSSLSRDSTAVSRWATSKGGEFLAAGVGASILGFRADCVTGNTLVRTKTGYTPISAIKPGDEVLAYDNEELSTGYHRVVAVAERAADLTYRIHAADGRVVEATGNHPVYSGGKFIPAMALAVGDPLLSCVWDGQGDQRAGDGQEDSQRSDAVLLRQVVLDNPHEHHGEGVQDPQNVQRLWETIHQQGTWSARLAGLLGGMPEGSASLGGTQEQNCSEPQLRPLRNVISSEEQRHPLAVLLKGVQEQGSQSANVCRQQSELATRERPEPLPSGQWSPVQGGAENGDVPGQSGMRDLCQHGDPSCSPRGRGRAEQLSDQRGDALPVVSHDAARCGTGEAAETTVARIEVVRGDQRVFDIQVEGVANFFAGGILVHNCAILDDPISSFEQAQSLTQLQKVHNWFETDLLTRLKPSGKIVLICQRLSPNDLAGYMIRRHAENPTRRLKLLILRMEAEDTPSCPDPLARSPGERLWPEWFTQQMVDDARRDEFKWKTLYQQNPPSDEGSWVSPDDIQFRPSPPLTSRSVRYGMSDIALSVNTGDYTVHAVVEIDPQGDWDIVEMKRERSDPDTTSTSLVNMAAVHRPVEWLIDDDNASKVFGPLVATKARQNSVSIPWRPLPMRGQDKETRAASLRGQYKRRKVFMPADAPWTSWLTRELLVFPNATGSGVDDGIDALSLLGRRMLAIARPQLTVVPKSLPTTSDMTLDELWEDMPNPSTARI